MDLRTAHKLDCMEGEGWLNTLNSIRYFQAFSSKDIKYDKEYDGATKVYKYDHVANTCYHCIVNSNYDPERTALKKALNVFKEKTKETNFNEGDVKITLNDIGVMETLKTKFVDEDGVINALKILVKAEYIADAKIKQTTYKSVELVESYGIKTQDINHSLVTRNLIHPCPVDTNCYEIDVAYKVNATRNGRFWDTVKLKLGNESKDITISDSNVHHITFKENTIWNGENKIDVELEQNGTTIINSLEIVSITYKYK